MPGTPIVDVELAEAVGPRGARRRRAKRSPNSRSRLRAQEGVEHLVAGDRGAGLGFERGERGQDPRPGVDQRHVEVEPDDQLGTGARYRTIRRRQMASYATCGDAGFVADECHSPGVRFRHETKTQDGPPVLGVRRARRRAGWGAARSATPGARSSRRSTRPGAGRRSGPGAQRSDGPVPIGEVDVGAAAPVPTGVAELDRVLGGGLVAGLGHPARRRAGHRQVHAAAPGARPLAAGGAALPARHAPRSRRSRCGSAPSGSARSHAEPARRRRDVAARTCSPTSTRVAPDVLAVDSIQTVVDPDAARRARVGHPGARVRAPARAARQGARRRHRARRPRHQGRRARRARACSSTSSTPCCRSRATAHHALRTAARAEAPVRLHRRARPVRDDRATACVDVPDPSALFLADRRAGVAGLGRRARCSRARGRCSSRCRRSSTQHRRADAAPVGRRASTAGGWRCCSRCSSSTPASTLGRRRRLRERRRRRARHRARRSTSRVALAVAGAQLGARGRRADTGGDRRGRPRRRGAPGRARPRGGSPRPRASGSAARSCPRPRAAPGLVRGLRAGRGRRRAPRGRARR